jgi:hypothetical protein
VFENGKHVYSSPTIVSEAGAEWNAVVKVHSLALKDWTRVDVLSRAPPHSA